MTLFKTTDAAGISTIHDCKNEEIAKQAHLLHFGLISINFAKVEVFEGNIEPCFNLACLSYIEELEYEKEVMK